jgi:simple sugar transport system permease protein
MIRRHDPQLPFLVLTNAAILVVGALATGMVFVDIYNFQSMASQVPELGLLALGVSLAMMSGNGGIDLSGIALANLAGVAAALAARGLVSVDDAPLTFSAVFIVLAVVLGLAGGFANGFLIACFGMTPILCTLGTQLLFTGVAVVLSNGRAVSTGSPAPLETLGSGAFLEIPIPFLLFIVAAAVIGAVLRFTPFGIRLLLMGSNPVAARFAGFAQARMLIATYALSGALAGLAGVVIAARNVNVKWDYGSSYLLIAILIVVMAGVKPEGGQGRIVCVVLSAIALQLLSSLLNFLEFSNFFRDLAWGLLLLFFLAVIRYDVFGALLALRTTAPAATGKQAEG